MKPALKDQIIRDVESLSEGKQIQVATFIKSLKNSGVPMSMTGKEAVRLFAGTMDEASAKEMQLAVEEGCEIVDAEGW
jgi:hypothetical protein